MKAKYYPSERCLRIFFTDYPGECFKFWNEVPMMDDFNNHPPVKNYFSSPRVIASGLSEVEIMPVGKVF